MNTSRATTFNSGSPAARLALTAYSAFAMALAARVALAQPILIDFEQLPGMPNVPGSTIPGASRLSDQYVRTHGVRFSSGSAFAAVVTHGAATPSGTRVIGGSTPAGC